MSTASPIKTLLKAHAEILSGMFEGLFYSVDANGVAPHFLRQISFDQDDTGPEDHRQRRIMVAEHARIWHRDVHGPWWQLGANAFFSLDEAIQKLRAIQQAALDDANRLTDAEAAASEASA